MTDTRREPFDPLRLAAGLCFVTLMLGLAYLACVAPRRPPRRERSVSAALPEPMSLELMSCHGNPDVTGEGVVDLDDLLLVLEGFRESSCRWTSDCIVDPNCLIDVCHCRQDRMHAIDLDDVLAVLDVFKTDGQGGLRNDICGKKDWHAWRFEKRERDEWVAMTKNYLGHYVALEGQRVRYSIVERNEDGDWVLAGTN